MNLELRPSLSMNVEPRLTLEARQQLKLLLTCQERLKDPEFPNAVKGLEGMVDADKILKDKNAIGILIGGLSVDSWRKTNREKLRNHKDVDVMVLNQEIDFGKFEGGVDWWLPSKYGKIVDQLVWANGNNVELNFALRIKGPPFSDYELSRLSGLHIPDPRWIIDAAKLALLRQYAIENPDKTVSEEAADALEQKLEKMFTEKVWGTYPQSRALCQPVKTKFGQNRILSENSSLWYPGFRPEPVALRKAIDKTERVK